MARVTEFDIFVRSTDMDADLIVNNAIYFMYFEQARLEHMLALGIIVEGDPSRTFTLAETSARFKAPAYHRDILTVKTRTAEVRNRSFVFAYEVVNKKTGKLVAEGGSTQVWLDAEGRPTPLPPDVRRVLEQSL
ncbi:MAG: thioesterase family protein [Dehalococcoidia bacterium]